MFPEMVRPYWLRDAGFTKIGMGDQKEESRYNWGLIHRISAVLNIFGRF
tara:strand:- start:637 stop:783 length:147 start_codon:yes stop_codon:yes gene_type:complete